MENLLKQAGLTEPQAKTYLFLLKTGEAAPPAVAKAMDLTRSNAYKVLDRLTELGLLRRQEIDKKFVYQAQDPIALTGIIATERNRLLELEKGVKDAMHELRGQYAKSVGGKEIQTIRGNQAVALAYQEQAAIKQPIRFIKSRADIPVMGHDLMAKIRHLSDKHNIDRYGITPDSPEAVNNPAIDRTTNLTRTWMHADDYTAPVEWSVSGDELLIISFENEATAIRIRNRTVAKAFQQVWQLLDSSLRRDPEYKKLPQQAQRKV